MTASAQAPGFRLAWEGKGPAGLGGEGARGAPCKVWLQLELPHQGLQAQCFLWSQPRTPGGCPEPHSAACSLHSKPRPQGLETTLCQADNTTDKRLVHLQGHQPRSSEPQKACCTCRPTVFSGESPGFSDS